MDEPGEKPEPSAEKVPAYLDEESDAGRDEAILERAMRRIGTVLKEKWRIDGLLGAGGTASVYSATHRNGSRVAIKMLHPELSLDPEVTRRFLREGYVANSVSHAGAVRVHDDDTAEDGSVFIVMDLLEGETLGARCMRFGGSLPTEELLPLVDELLDVLAAAHEKGIVHRDIKPENVFVTREGQVKLLDFGIARLRTIRGGTVNTVTGALFGTPAYMPPEQARGRTDQIDAQSDLWAVGAMMFSLSAGRFVHVAETINEQLMAHAANRAPSLGSVKRGVPSSVVRIVDRALSFDKAKRWPDARTMQQAVRNAMEQLGFKGRKPSATPEDADMSAPMQPLMMTANKADEPALAQRRTLLVAVICLSAVVLVGAGIALHSMRGQETTPPVAATANEPPANVPAATTPATPTTLAAPIATPAAPAAPAESTTPAASPTSSQASVPRGAVQAPSGAKGSPTPTSTGAPAKTAKPPPPPTNDDDLFDRQH